MHSFVTEPRIFQPRVGEVPARFADRTLDTFTPATPSQTRALKEARRFVAGEIGSLVFIGPAGVGKTHLAAGISNALITKEIDRVSAAYEANQAKVRAIESGEAPRERLTPRRPAYLDPEYPRWQNVAELISGLRMDMDRDREDRSWAERLGVQLRECPMLVLDDLGREKVSDWTGELVYGLINGRYENNQRTIATSNLSAAELQASGYWTSISRLAEDGALVEITAPDHRLAR